MNTEDDEFERIEREQAMRSVPDPIHHADTRESLEYITGWNDCRAAMLAEQPAQQEPVGIVKDLFTNAAWDKLDVVGSTKVYLDFPPAQQEPLTDEEMAKAWVVADGEHNASSSVKRRITRAIEAAHNIKENT